MKASESDLPFAASARGEREDGSGLPDLHHIGMVVADLDQTPAGLPTSLGRGPAHFSDCNMSTPSVTSSGVVGLNCASASSAWRTGLSNYCNRWRSITACQIPEGAWRRHGSLRLSRSLDRTLAGRGAAASDDGQSPALLAEAPSNNGHGISFCHIDGKNEQGAVIELFQITLGVKRFSQPIYEITGGRLPT